MSRNAWILILITLALMGVIIMLPKGTTGNVVETFAQAISVAEGFGVPGAIPTVRNNPGDLELGADGVVTTFATVQDGWNALYAQINLIIAGTSNVYSLDDTIATMADKYTGGDNAAGWAQNVATVLGVTVDTPLRSILT